MGPVGLHIVRDRATINLTSGVYTRSHYVCQNNMDSLNVSLLLISKIKLLHE